MSVSESVLCQFIAQLANEQVSHTTVKCCLSVVRHLHIEQGLGDPGIRDMPRLEQVLKGIKSMATPPSRGAKL